MSVPFLAHTGSETEAMQASPIGIYIHVPYCRVVCPYCDFVKKRTIHPAPDAFTEAICSEIAHFEGPRQAMSLFFGGGTPSLLSPESLERIVQAVHSRFTFNSPEISIEANPDDVTDDLIQTWTRLGVNRVTLGVQSFDDEVLAYLGRCHDAETARRACTRVADAFANWGLDLIFGAPPVSAWESTLEECRAFAPPHVSTYGLTYEKRTPFWSRREEALDDDASLELYRRARARLEGYGHYEISNFAIEGFESRHNSIYWRNDAYAGFGPGAYSYLDGIRSRNHEKVNTYIAKPGEKTEALHLTALEIRQETLIQHFRTRAGIRKDGYRARFGTGLHDDFAPRIDGLIERGLLAETPEAIVPTQKGFELNDEIGLALVLE